MNMVFKCVTCDICPPDAIPQQMPLNCTLDYGNGGTDACYFIDFGDEQVEPRRFLAGSMSRCDIDYSAEFALGP